MFSQNKNEHEWLYCALLKLSEDIDLAFKGETQIENETS